MNGDVKSPMCPIRDRVAEVRDRTAGGGVILLDNMDAALIGTFHNQQGKVVAVYEEGMLIDLIRNRLQSERPGATEDELNADSVDLLGDLVRSFPYMAEAGAPLIIEGLE